MAGLEKMKITGYKIITYKRKVKVPPKNGANNNSKPKTKVITKKRIKRDDKKEYKVTVNPGTYRLSYKNKYNKNQAPGKIGNFLKFNKSKPEVLEVEFLFDQTGTVPGTFKALKKKANALEEYSIRQRTQKNGIIPELNKFKKVVYDYDCKQHKPRYLYLRWGTLSFKGILTEMTVDFKLFLPSGVPIRANVKAKFEGSVEDDLEKAKKNKKSADTTHSLPSHAGDKLPLMCYEVYDDPGQYIQIARVNDLVNFRSLEIGHRLRFPPLKDE